MTEDDSRINISRSFAEKVDRLKDQTELGFNSRNEIFRHALREYLLDLTRIGILPPKILRRIR